MPTRSSGRRSRETFFSRVAKVGINPCIEVPDAVIQALLRQATKPVGPIPVAGIVDGAAFRATVVKFRGKWRLYFNTQMRRDAGVGVGDEVVVSLTFDPEPRVPPIPPLLRAALPDDEDAARRWEALAPSRRKEILAYLNSLKTQASVERNVAKIMSQLRRPSPAARG